MTNVRKILLIGRTGNGKSTLANVLSETNFFKESTGSVSETKNIQIADFEVDLMGNAEGKLVYRVIDTIGIGDTKLDPKDVLIRIGEACHEVSSGLNQILFVIKGKFTEEEMEAYNLLRSTIFDKEITNYTTIVRTDFADFEDEEKCEEDKRKIDDENPQLAELIRSCNKKIVYVNNLPLKGSASAVAKILRDASRKKILEHLIVNCGNYKPVSLERLEERIGSYMTEKEQLKKELENLKNSSERERIITQLKIAELEAKIEVEVKKKVPSRGCLVS